MPRRRPEKGGKRPRGSKDGRDRQVAGEPSPAPKGEAAASAKPDEDRAESQARPAPPRPAPIRRGRVLQPIRRAALVLSLATVVVLPLASLARAVERGGGAPQVGAPGIGPRIAAAAPWLAPVGGVFSGSVWSITIAGFEVADPLAATLVVAAGRSAVLLAAAALPVLATLLGGRLFCGWVCPARLPVELAAWIRRKWRPRVRAPWLRWAKYGVLAAGLGLAALTGWNLVALIYPPAILVREAHYFLVYGAAGWGAVVVVMAFAADLVVERGAWCRGLCPGGALYSLLGQPAILNLRVDQQRCTRCERCLKLCPLGLDPTAAPGGECDRCGLCQRACREDALRYRVGWPFDRGASVGAENGKVV